jgi:hypothetical protein
MTQQLPGYIGSPLIPITMPSTLVPPLSDAEHSQDQLYRDRAPPGDGAIDDHATVSLAPLAPGTWPRVFPGL